MLPKHCVKLNEQMKYTLNKIFFLAILILISSFSYAQNKLTEKEIIFEESQNINIRSEYSDFKKFTLKKGDIEIVNIYLSELLKTERLNFENYYIQYVGLIRENENLIFYNASCKKTEWFETEILEVKGGGKCYFSGLFNLTEKKTEKFNFNASK